MVPKETSLEYTHYEKLLVFAMFAELVQIVAVIANTELVVGEEVLCTVVAEVVLVGVEEERNIAAEPVAVGRGLLYIVAAQGVLVEIEEARNIVAESEQAGIAVEEGIAAESLVALETEQVGEHIALGKKTAVVHLSEAAAEIVLEDIGGFARGSVEEHFLQQSNMVWRNRLLG